MKTNNELHSDCILRINEYKIIYNHYLRVRKSFTDNYLYYLEDYNKRYGKVIALKLLKQELIGIKRQLNHYSMLLKKNKYSAKFFNKKINGFKKRK